MGVPLSWWGSFNKRTNVRTCGPASVSTTTDLITALRWQLDGVPDDLRLAGVRLYVISNTAAAGSRAPALAPTLADMPFCDVQNPGPPFADGGMPLIIAGVTGTSPPQLHYESDFLTAHVQAAITYGESRFPGYLMTSNGSVSYAAPQLMLLYYRVPPARAGRATAPR